jgi:hypothetical protein
VLGKKVMLGLKTSQIWPWGSKDLEVKGEIKNISNQIRGGDKATFKGRFHDQKWIVIRLALRGWR